MFVCYRMVFDDNTFCFTKFLQRFPKKLFIHIIVQIIQSHFNLRRLSRIVGVDDKPWNREVESLRFLQLPEVQSPLPRIHRSRCDTVLIPWDLSVIPHDLFLHVLVDKRIDD